METLNKDTKTIRFLEAVVMFLVVALLVTFSVLFNTINQNAANLAPIQINKTDTNTVPVSTPINEAKPVYKRFESQRYNLSFSYPVELGTPSVKYNEVPYKDEIVSFSTSPISIIYPIDEVATGDVEVKKVEATSINGTVFEITVMSIDGASPYYVTAFPVNSSPRMGITTPKQQLKTTEDADMVVTTIKSIITSMSSDFTTMK